MEDSPYQLVQPCTTISSIASMAFKFYSAQGQPDETALINGSLPSWVSCGIFRCLHHVDFCFRWKNRSTQTTSTFHQLCLAQNYWRGWWSNHHPPIISLLSIWALKCCNYTRQTARQIAEFPGFFAGEDGSSACNKCPKGTYQGSQGHADTWWSFLWFLGSLARSFPHVGVHWGRRRQASSEKWIANASISRQFWGLCPGGLIPTLLHPSGNPASP